MSKQIKLNELAVAGLLLDNYPGIDLLVIDGHTVEELKENAAVGNYTLAQLEEAAKDCGDPFFLWIIREVKEGGQHGDDPDFPYNRDLIVEIMERGRRDLAAIIGAFENL